MALAARDSIALPSLSSAGWFFPLPSLEYAAGNVAPTVCHLALVAARVPRAGIREAAQSDNRPATIPDWPAAVEPVETWPKFVVPGPPLHGARSDSPAQ